MKNTRFKRRGPNVTGGTVPGTPTNSPKPLKAKKGEKSPALTDGKPEIWRGRGRPRALSLDDVVIDAPFGGRKISRRDALKSLGQWWVTQEEVAAFFGVHIDTLIEFFKREPEARVIYEDAKLSGNISQRRRNAALAEKSAAMSIFLSKNQLGMKDDLSGSLDVNHRGTVMHRLMDSLRDGTHGKVIEHDKNEFRGTGNERSEA